MMTERYREHNNEMKAAIPHIFLYDKTGAETLSASTWMKWDTIKFKTRHFHYIADTDRIYLEKNAKGLFDIIFECSLSGGAGVVTFQLYKNGTALDGSVVRSYAQYTGQDTMANSVSLQYACELKRGDYLQVKASVSGSDLTTVTDSCRIQVKFIPVFGFNNGNGGRQDYKGVIR